MQFNIFDSDGNLVEHVADAALIGRVVAQHYALVADTTRLNALIGVPPADEPFLTIVREPEDEDLTICQSRGFHEPSRGRRLTAIQMLEAGEDLCVDCAWDLDSEKLVAVRSGNLNLHEDELRRLLAVEAGRLHAINCDLDEDCTCKS